MKKSAAVQRVREIAKTRAAMRSAGVAGPGEERGVQGPGGFGGPGSALGSWTLLS